MISIIIPTYNRAHLLIETLTSIKNQTYQNWECLIVDDASIDNTFEVIQEFSINDKRFQYFTKPKELKKGPSACRNYAFQFAKGTFIQFFDSDDIMHPEHLQEKINVIEDNDFVVCKLKEFQHSFSKELFNYNDREAINYEKDVFQAFATGAFPMMMVAPMWKKEYLENFMPIREDLHILEDHELHARALFQNPKYDIINKALIFYRVGAVSSTNTFYKDISYGLTSYFEAKKTVLRLSNNTSIKLAILKMTLGFFRMGLAQKKYKEAEKCIQFIKEEKLAYSFVLQLKLKRIQLFYSIFKSIGKGDTRFNYFLKL